MAARISTPRRTKLKSPSTAGAMQATQANAEASRAQGARFDEAIRAQGEEICAELRAQGVRFEQLQSQLSMAIEALTGQAGALRAEMHEMETRLTARISELEAVVRQNSADIRPLKDDVRGLKDGRGRAS